MLEVISGFVVGFLAEKLIQKRMKSWSIALVIAVTAFVVHTLYHLVVLKESVAQVLSPVWLVISLYTGLFLITWAIVGYFYYIEGKRSKYRIGYDGNKM